VDQQPEGRDCAVNDASDPANRSQQIQHRSILPIQCEKPRVLMPGMDSAMTGILEAFRTSQN
jgi:hypothetical protein